MVPYRRLPDVADEPSEQTREGPPLDVAGVLTFLWIVTLGYVVSGAAPAADKPLAWLVVVALPAGLAREFGAIVRERRVKQSGRPEASS